MEWDKAREIILENQKCFRVVPKGTKFTKRIPKIPAWDFLSDQDKKLYAGQMEHADHQIGRIVTTLERIGELDNALIFVTADNSASGGGGLSGTANETYVLKVALDDTNSTWERIWLIRTIK